MAPAALDWAEKHRPLSLAGVLGNEKAVGEMRRWADAWATGMPERKALLLEGKPGTGKTTAAHALARDRRWGVLELNASDARNAAAIERVAGKGATHQTFTDSGEFLTAAEGGRKLIILDEADNLYERVSGGTGQATGEDLSDRGGKRAILDTIARTRQPIVLIANDVYELTRGSGAALKRLCIAVRFHHAQTRTIARRLAEVCAAEGVEAEPEALMAIADHSEGDMRAALNDLQSVAEGKRRLSLHEVGGLGFRDTGRTVFEVLPEIFKGTDARIARRAKDATDEDPASFILWVDENLPLEYQRPADLARGYEALSRADVFLGRVRRRQYYGLWGYASDLMTAGVAVAKDERPQGWARYQFPQWLVKMSRSRAARSVRASLAAKVGAAVHTSARQALLEDVPFLARLAEKDEGFAARLAADLALTAEETAHLLGTTVATARVGRILEAAERLRGETEPDVVEFGSGATRAGARGVSRGAPASANRSGREARPAGAPSPPGAEEVEDEPGDPRPRRRPPGPDGPPTMRATNDAPRAPAPRRAKHEGQDRETEGEDESDAKPRPDPKKQKSLLEY